MSYLPRDVLMIILSYVFSLTTIVRCRCVCKVWLEVLLDPHFARMHFSRARAQPCVLFDNFVSFERDYRYKYWPKLRCFRLLDFHQEESSSYYYDDIKLFSLKYKLPKSYSPKLLGSCNGLLCFKDSYDLNSPLYVSNPLTMEYAILPTVPPQDLDNDIYGFGFSPKTSQYKVIQLCSNPCSDRAVATTTMVHTLGTGVWRNIGNALHALHDSNLHNTFPIVYVNGTLNWIASCSWNGSLLISSFDLETEQFGSLTLVLPTAVHEQHYLNLGVFGDCFSISCSDDWRGRNSEIWVLQKENYNQKYTWIKKLIIEADSVELLAVLKNEEIVYFSRGVLTLYNPRNRSSRFPKNNGALTIVAHVPCFISLKDVAAVGEHWKVIKARPSRYIL